MVTPVQHKSYEFIRQYIHQKGYSPSLSEIAVGIGISPNSISLISRSIHALADAGWLKLNKKGYRNIALMGGHRVALPVIGRMAAGGPIEAIEEKRHLELTSLLPGSDLFVYEVKGDSMAEDGIVHGDFIICKPADAARENDSVVALIDGRETLLKRVSYQIQGHITLIPTNPALKPKAYLPHRVQIQGVYIGLFRSTFYASSSR